MEKKEQLLVIQPANELKFRGEYSSTHPEDRFVYVLLHMFVIVCWNLDKNGHMSESINGTIL